MKLTIKGFRPQCLLGFAFIIIMISACQTSDTTPIGLGGIFNQPTRYAVAAPNDTTPNSKAGQPIGGAVETAALLPAGNYTLTTVRERPAGGDIPKVLCQAPSPDWATALAMQQQLSASGNFFHGSSGQFSGTNSSTETIAAMAGRTAGVVALRDGLYSACQAYANGVIGKDAYALILSQYGYLLIALAGNNGMSSSGSSDKTSSLTTASTPPGVAVAVNTATAAPASQAQQQSKTADTSSATGIVTLAQMQIQILHALVVACISANDRSVQSQEVNPLLTTKACEKLFAWMQDNTTSLVTSIAGASKAINITTAKAELPDLVVLEVQVALHKQSCTGCQELVPDGIEGNQTKNAISAYQKENGLTPNGNAKDPSTLAKLGIKA